MMPNYNPYDDPELTPPADNSDGEVVQFKSPGDSVTGQVTEISKVNANGRPTALYRLWNGRETKLMFVGESPKDLKRQLWKLVPHVGDTITATLLEIDPNNNFKRFDVTVDKAEGGALAPAGETVAPQRVSAPPARSASQSPEDDADIFDS